VKVGLHFGKWWEADYQFISRGKHTVTIMQDIFTSTGAVRVEPPEVAAAAGELVDDVCDGFFAPVAFDVVDQLLARYNAEAASIHAVGEFIQTPGYRSALSHFMGGNAENFSPVLRNGVAGLYSVDGALGHLNGCYWNELLNLTDVLE
jgi:hypothetical protein